MAYRKFNDIEYPVPGIDTAIDILRPGSRWRMENKTFTGWVDDEGQDPPTWEEIEKEIEREIEIYEYYSYERNREKEYPNVKEQLDMLYHDIKSGNLSNGSWISRIEEVKKNNPKPENTKLAP